MKKLVLMLFLGFYTAVFAQYKDPGFPTTTVEDGILNHSNSSDNNIFGFLNSDNFEMHHQFDLSYSAFGNQGLALSIYTNSMLYNFSDNLNVQTDISFVNSPYTTLSKDFQNNLNGIYLTKAALNYRPWKNFDISVEYNRIPNGLSPYSFYGSSFNRQGFYAPYVGY
jgi:hypothetical protein